MTTRWELVEQRMQLGTRYLIIKCDGIRIADVFPDAGMYRGKVEPEWVIEQAQAIVDAMNASEAAP